MSHPLLCGQPCFMGFGAYPASRGKFYLVGGQLIVRQRLPTDSIGNMTLTLTNVVIGSAIRIDVQSTGALVEFRTATATSEVFTVPVYAGGSASNDLRIKVRKGTTAPKYQPFETLVIAAVGAQSVYVAQVADPIA